MGHIVIDVNKFEEHKIDKGKFLNGEYSLKSRHINMTLKNIYKEMKNEMNQKGCQVVVTGLKYKLYKIKNGD